MQSTHQYQPHTLSSHFIDQFNQEKNQLKRAYCNALTDIQGLQHTYSKAFDPFFCPAWYDKATQFKKPLAEKIVAVATEFEEGLSDSSLFLGQIDILKQTLTTVIADNRAQDPAFFFDTWRNKPLGGRLGEKLDAYQVVVDTLLFKKEKFVEKYILLCKNRLHYLHTALALIREKKIVLEQTDGGLYASNVPFQDGKDYHFHRALQAHLNNTIDDEALIEFVNQEIVQFEFVLIDGEYSRIKKIGQQYNKALLELEHQCMRVIEDTKLVFFEVFIANLSIEKKQATDLVQRFLLTDFLYQLPFKEKEYWWRLIVQAQRGYHGRLNKEVKVARQYTDVIRDEFWDELVRCYTSNPTLYAGYPTIEVLKNAWLISQFKNNQIDNAALLDKFKQAVSNEDIPLNKLLSEDEDWKLIDAFPDCNWQKSIIAEFEQSVIKPMTSIRTMALDPQCVDESSYLGQLFLRATAYVKAAPENEALPNEKKALGSY